MTENKEIERIKKEYDRRAREIPVAFYSLKQPGNRLMYDQRKEKMLELLKVAKILPLENKKILEVGCGSGIWLEDFSNWDVPQKNLYGLDLETHLIEKAKAVLPNANLSPGNAENLPWPDKFFDVVLQSTMFTSILDPRLKQKIAHEMRRVLKENGVILWYDFRYDNPKNRNVKGITGSEIRKLFPGAKVILKKATLIPFLARWLAPKFLGVCRVLSRIPFMNSHYVGLIRWEPERG
ncbi:MAG: class I SAM-dependent methyltransferase [Candidatus Omnitrophica bacterium]|nr:class I SAM-dependent methyltransferase [Candidatus Omnitrophota bacterium]